MPVELTDPSSEIADLGAWLRSLPDTGNPTWTVLLDAMSLEKQPHVLLELVAAVISRLVKLEEFTRTVSDVYLKDRRREQTLTAIRAFETGFDPRNLVTPWTNFKSNFLKPEYVTALDFFGEVAQRHVSLRVTTEEERRGLIGAIETAIAELDEQAEIPAWARGPLRDGLTRLKLVLQHIRFFGHEAAIEQIGLLAGKATAVNSHANKEAPARTWRIMKVMHVLAIAAEIFAAPHHAIEASAHYKHLYADYVRTYIESTLPRLMLPAPDRPSPPNVTPEKPAEPPRQDNSSSVDV